MKTGDTAWAISWHSSTPIMCEVLTAGPKTAKVKIPLIGGAVSRTKRIGVDVFPTWAECRSEMLRRKQAELDSTRVMLHRLAGEVGNLRGLKDPTQ